MIHFNVDNINIKLKKLLISNLILIMLSLYFFLVFIFLLKERISRSIEPLNIHVSYNKTNYSCPEANLSSCGSLEKPFDSLFQSFYFLDLNSKDLEQNYSQINILLLSNQYILDPGNFTYFLAKLNTNYGTSEAVWKVFGRFASVILNIEIKPLNLSYRSQIHLKTFFISFQVNIMSLTFSNVIVSGFDLNLNSNFLLTASSGCLFWALPCCSDTYKCSSILPSGTLNGVLAPFHLFEINSPISPNNFTSFYLFSCDFISLELRKSILNKGILNYLHGFLAIKHVRSLISLTKCLFQDISFRSYMVGTNENEPKVTVFNAYRNVTVENCTMIRINTDIKALSNANATFECTNTGTVAFINSTFETIKIFFNAVGMRNLTIVNCFFQQKYFITTISKSSYTLFGGTYLAFMKNVFFNENMQSERLIYFLSAIIYIENLTMKNQNFTSDNAIVLTGSSVKIYLNQSFFSFLYQTSYLGNFFLISKAKNVVIENCKFINLKINSTFNLVMDLDFSVYFLLNERKFLQIYIRNLTFNDRYMKTGKLNLNLINGTGNLLFLNRIYGYNFAFLLTENVNITILNSIFKSKDYYSNILHAVKNNIIFFSNCTFIKLKSNVKGTIFSIENGNYLILTKVYFQDITNFEAATIVYAISSNVISIKHSILNLLETFDNGGGCLVVDHNIIFINDSLITNYTTINSGGFIYAIQSGNYIQITNSKFEGGSSADGGFIFLNYENFLHIKSSFFKNHSAGLDGGTFKFNVLNIVLLSDCIIEDSNSRELSGSISIYKQNKVKILSSRFTGSFANSAGVFSINLENKLILHDVKFIKIEVVEIGSFAKISSNNIIKIGSSTFQNVYSGNKGGIFSIDSMNSVLIRNSSFINSFSNEDAFTFKTLNNIIISGSTFENNLNETITHFFDATGDLNLLELKNISNLQSTVNILFNLIKRNEVRLVRVNIKKLIVNKYVFQASSDSIILLRNVNIISANENIILIIFNLQNSSLIMKNCTLVTKQKKNLLKLGLFYQSKIILNHTSVIFKIPFIEQTTPSYNIQARLSFIIFNHFFATQFNILFNISSFKFEKSCLLLAQNSVAIKILLTYSQNLSYYLNFSISNSIFMRIKNNGEGGAIFYENNNQNQNYFSIKKCLFANNIANKGSVIFSKNIDSLNISGNKFYNNYAYPLNKIYSKGGVFHFEKNSGYTNYHIMNNSFVKNRANVGGILYLAKGYPFIEDLCFLKNNYLEDNLADYYGNTMATIPFKIKSNIDTSKITPIVISGLVSGENYISCLALIYFVDGYENLALNNELEERTSYEDLDISLNLNPNSPNNWKFENGQLCFYGFFKINSTVSQKFSVNLTFSYFNQSNIIKKSQVNILYNFRPCGKGEKINSEYICEICPRSFYSFETEVDFSTSCSVCSENLPFYCFGGNNITLKSGSWRSSYDSSRILTCPNPDSCIGDNRIFQDSTMYKSQFAKQRCTKGYKDPLCAVCDVGYGISGKYTCQNCDKLNYITKMLFLFFLQLSICFLTIYKSFIMSRNISNSKIEEKDAVLSNLLKLLFTHSQILLIICSMEDGWKRNLSSVMEGNPFNSNFSDSLSLQCLFRLMGIDISFIYVKLIISISTPFFLFIVSIGYLKFYLLTFRANRKMEALILKRLYNTIGFGSMIQGLIFVIISLQATNVIRDCFEMFIYINVEDTNKDPDFRLISDYSVQYQSETHRNLRNYISAPVIIFFGIVFPLFILIRIYLKKKTDSLKTPHNLFVYGYFFYPYEEKLFFWDIVYAIQKLSIQGIAVLSQKSEDEESKIVNLLIILGFLIIGMYLSMKFKPYKNELRRLNNAEEISFFILTLSTILLMSLFKSQNQSEWNGYDTIKLTLLGVSNGLFFLYFIFLYYTNSVLSKWPQKLNTYMGLKSARSIGDKSFLSRDSTSKRYNKSNIEMTFSAKPSKDVENKLYANNKLDENSEEKEDMDFKLIDKAIHSFEWHHFDYIKKKKKQIQEINKIVISGKLRNLKIRENIFFKSSKFNVKNLCFQNEKTYKLISNQFVKIIVKYFLVGKERSIQYHFYLITTNQQLEKISGKLEFKKVTNQSSKVNS